VVIGEERCQLLEIQDSTSILVESQEHRFRSDTGERPIRMLKPPEGEAAPSRQYVGNRVFDNARRHLEQTPLVIRQYVGNRVLDNARRHLSQSPLRIRHSEHQQVSHNAHRTVLDGRPRSADQGHPERCLTRRAIAVASG
jgi:hypothetical protein